MLRLFQQREKEFFTADTLDASSSNTKPKRRNTIAVRKKKSAVDIAPIEQLTELALDAHPSDVHDVGSCQTSP